MKNKSTRAVQFLLIFCLVTVGCSESMASIREQLEYTIERSDKGKIKKKIEARAGGIPLQIESMDIKQTYKEVYTFSAIVKFKEKKLLKASGQLPKVGDLPTTKNKSTIRVQFKYLKSEDRWYFDKYL